MALICFPCGLVYVRGAAKHQKCQLLLNIVLCDTSFDFRIPLHHPPFPHPALIGHRMHVKRRLAKLRNCMCKICRVCPHHDEWRAIGPTMQMPTRETNANARKNVNCIPSIYLFVYSLHFHFLLSCRIFIATCVHTRASPPPIRPTFTHTTDKLLRNYIFAGWSQCQLPISENKMWQTLPATALSMDTAVAQRERESERDGHSRSERIQEYKVYPRELCNTRQFIIT